jgi:hypothetical protein
MMKVRVLMIHTPLWGPNCIHWFIRDKASNK